MMAIIPLNKNKRRDLCERVLERLVDVHLDARLGLVCFRAVASERLLRLGEVGTNSL
jgi:hypothetical protein